MDNYLPFVFLFGLAVTGVGFLALLVTAFRVRVWWGLLLFVFPPTALVFAAKHFRKAATPLGIVLAGVLITATPPVINRLLPIDLGPRERVVDGELHLTLTGWDRKDYSVLRQKPQTVVLQMANPDVDDQTLRYLTGMGRLRELDLNGSRVTDAGLAVLRSMPSLATVRLRDTLVTDAGFQESLSRMEALKRLDLRGTKVSREAVKAWKDGGPGRTALQ